MKTITKIKNFEGYEYTCSNCGRTLKHAYTIGSDNSPLGKECVRKMAGFSNKALKNADDKMYNLMRLRTMFTSQYNKLVAEFGDKTDDMILSGQLR